MGVKQKFMKETFNKVKNWGKQLGDNIKKDGLKATIPGTPDVFIKTINFQEEGLNSQNPIDKEVATNDKITITNNRDRGYSPDAIKGLFNQLDSIPGFYKYDRTKQRLAREYHKGYRPSESYLQSLESQYPQLPNIYQLKEKLLEVFDPLSPETDNIPSENQQKIDRLASTLQKIVQSSTSYSEQATNEVAPTQEKINKPERIEKEVYDRGENFKNAFSELLVDLKDDFEILRNNSESTMNFNTRSNDRMGKYVKLEDLKNNGEGIDRQESEVVAEKIDEAIKNIIDRISSLIFKLSGELSKSNSDYYIADNKIPALFSQFYNFNQDQPTMSIGEYLNKLDELKQSVEKFNLLDFVKSRSFEREVSSKIKNVKESLAGLNTNENKIKSLQYHVKMGIDSNGKPLSEIEKEAMNRVIQELKNV